MMFWISTAGNSLPSLFNQIVAASKAELKEREAQKIFTLEFFLSISIF